MAIVVALSVATVLGASMATGRAPTPSPSLDPALFTRVGPAEPLNFEAAVPELPARSAAPIVVETIPDFQPPERSFAPRPQPDLRQAVGVIVKATPAPRPRPASGGGGGGGGAHRVRGTASWYCQSGVSDCHYQYASGMYAAAGPALRVGDWRGRSVRVCSGSRCVNVRLIDWCQCYGTRVIDLYSDAFRRLAPLSGGTLRVTVSW